MTSVKLVSRAVTIVERQESRDFIFQDRTDARGYATLRFDPLTPHEAADRRIVFDIPLLADRVVGACMWAARSTRSWVGPNEQSMSMLRCKADLRIVSGADHLFEEPGTLDLAVTHVPHWFPEHLASATDRSLPIGKPRIRPDIATLREAVEPLPEINDPEFAKAFDRYARKRYRAFNSLGCPDIAFGRQIIAGLERPQPAEEGYPFEKLGTSTLQSLSLES